MTQVAETVLESILKLPVADRREIVDRLCESLWNMELEPDEELAWQNFINERLAAADRGDFAPGTAFDVIEEVRRELHQQREVR